MATGKELIRMYEQAYSLESKGFIQQAVELYQGIVADEGCPKQLLMTVEKALARIESKQQPVPETLEAIETDSPHKEKIIYVDPFALESLPSIEGKMPIKEEDYDRMKEDIKKRGIQIPLITLPNFKILCGYNRCKIAKELELPTVPVIVKDVPSADRMEFALKDNIMRRQLTSDQLAEFVLDLPTQPIGRPIKHSRAKTNKDIANALGVSKRTVQRAKAFAKKIQVDPDVKTKSITAVLAGNDNTKSQSIKYEYTIGVDEARIAEDLVEIADKVFDFDIQNGDKLKIAVQLYHTPRR